MVARMVRPASRDSLPALLTFVRERCARAGLPAAVAADVCLATEEACTNVIEHGYAGMSPGPIALRLEHDGERVVVSVEDQASPFDPRSIAAPDIDAPWDERQLGGLGWHLINTLMDEVRHEPLPVGNRLTLVKRVTP
jgi:anti-sigma regulatory factor (Ser/Thr protein kinase)